MRISEEAADLLRANVENVLNDLQRLLNCEAMVVIGLAADGTMYSFGHATADQMYKRLDTLRARPFESVPAHLNKLACTASSTNAASGMNASQKP